MQIFLDAFPVLDQVTEARNLRALGYPAPADWAKANTFTSTLGREPGRGWLLLPRRVVDLLATPTAGAPAFHTLELINEDGSDVEVPGLVFVKGACLTPGTSNDPESCHLAEFADKRWLLANPLFRQSINRQYNVRAPAYSAATQPYYAGTINAGTAWTWAGLCQDLWNVCSTQLGAWPGLPATTLVDGTPEGWVFDGVGAWDALCFVLQRLGCAVAPFGDGTFTIVQVGAADAFTTALLALLENTSAGAGSRKILDREHKDGLRGEVPYGVRVYFRKVNLHAGLEETARQDASAWQTAAAIYSVDVVGPQSSVTESGVYHPIWDDLPATLDQSDAVTNVAALATRAANRSADYYRQVLPVGKLPTWLAKTYTGAQPVPTGSIVKAVRWGQDPLGIGAHTPGGLITEVIRHPYPTVAVDDNGCCVPTRSRPDQPPDWGPTWPIYPAWSQEIRVANGTADGNGHFDSFVERFQPATPTWLDREVCWGVELNGMATVTAQRYPARLNGYANGRPVYTFLASTGSGGAGCVSFVPGPGLTSFGTCGGQVTAGCGTKIDGANKVAFDNAAAAGPGLVAFSTCQLAVGLGCGVKFDGSNNVTLKQSDYVGPGLKNWSACGVQANVGGGIIIVGGVIQINYGYGLYVTAGGVLKWCPQAYNGCVTATDGNLVLPVDGNGDPFEMYNLCPTKPQTDITSVSPAPSCAGVMCAPFLEFTNNSSAGLNEIISFHDGGGGGGTAGFCLSCSPLNLHPGQTATFAYDCNFLCYRLKAVSPYGFTGAVSVITGISVTFDPVNCVVNSKATLAVLKFECGVLVSVTASGTPADAPAGWEAMVPVAGLQRSAPQTPPPMVGGV